MCTVNSESHSSADEETGFVGDDEDDEGSDKEEEVGVAHDTRFFRSPEDIRMENVSFTESLASECQEYYTDSSYYSPIETTSDEDGASHLTDPADFTKADIDDLLLKEKEIDGPTELRRFLVEFFSRTKTSGAAATSF